MFRNPLARPGVLWNSHSWLFNASADYLSRLIRIRREVVSLIIAHARSLPSEEVCGFLAGREGTITCAFAAKNIAANATAAYDVAPKEIVEKMREIREANLEFLGIYHSHPSGANEPSPTDIELAAYPDAASFILSPRADVAQPIRAFSIRDGIARELKIEFVE